jgi:Sulfotransferase family
MPRKAHSKKQLGRRGPVKRDRSRREPVGSSVEPDLSLASWQDADRLFRAVREAIVPVDQPLVLISQTQRSGGTLLNNLLDGHPRLHVHPYELLIGHPRKADWPSFDLGDGADGWLEVLREQFIGRLFADGYRKKPDMRDIVDFPVLPFTLAPSFLERLFRLVCAEDPPQSGRQILDRYLTAFFNAWVDCQGLRDAPKSWVVGFGPRLAWGESRARFRADYPDGRIVAVHRDPRAWYASASLFSRRYGEFDEALALWRRGSEELLAAKAEDPERVFALTYERLVTEPEPTMRALADWLRIKWHPILLEPTFNRQETVPNSSFRLLETGIREESLERWREVLSAETVKKIEAETLELDGAVREASDLA